MPATPWHTRVAIAVVPMTLTWKAFLTDSKGCLPAVHAHLSSQRDCPWSTPLHGPFNAQYQIWLFLPRTSYCSSFLGSMRLMDQPPSPVLLPPHSLELHGVPCGSAPCLGWGSSCSEPPAAAEAATAAVPAPVPSPPGLAACMTLLPTRVSLAAWVSIMLGEHATAQASRCASTHVEEGVRREEPPVL